MSLCPTKDIHSVYLDNELPLSYVAEYENHVRNCARCSAELDNLKKLRSLMTQDSSKTELGKKDLDESFARLQMKMHFKKNTRSFRHSEHETIKYVIPAVAAAAVFALILPVGLKSKGKQVQVYDTTALNTIAPTITGSTVMNGTTVSTNTQKTRKNFMRDVDVFRPNFDNENNISIKITVPGINATPYTTEIELPADLYKGFFE